MEEKPEFIGLFKAFTTKEGTTFIKDRDLNLIILHIQRQPVVLVAWNEEDDDGLIAEILSKAGAK